LQIRPIEQFELATPVFIWEIFDGFHVKSCTFKKSSSRFPISLLRLDHLSGRTLWTCLVLGGVYPAERSSHLKNGNFSKNTGDMYPTLEDHISGSTWSTCARVCLLERSNSQLFIKNMKFGIYRLLPILGRLQYLVDCIFRGTSDPTGSLWGLETPTIELYKTSIKSLYTFRVFAKKKFFFLNFWTFVNFCDFCWSKGSKIWLLLQDLWEIGNITERDRPKITFY
jgi:hypothetical protein